MRLRMLLALMFALLVKTRLYDLGAVFKFVCFTEISRRGAITIIAVGISPVNALILSVLIVII